MSSALLATIFIIKVKIQNTSLIAKGSDQCPCAELRAYSKHYNLEWMSIKRQDMDRATKTLRINKRFNNLQKMELISILKLNS